MLAFPKSTVDDALADQPAKISVRCVRNPIRKIWYDLVIAAKLVFVALFIGGIEARGAVRSAIDAPNDRLDTSGYIVVGILLASWALSYLICRRQRLDERLLGEQA
jgi:high-affinity nickel permease